MGRIIIIRLLDSYFRHRWLYLLPIVLSLIAGIVYLLIAPPQYNAQSVIYVQKQSLLSSLTAVNNPGFTWSTPAQVTTGEIKDLIQTDSFVRSLIMETDLEANMNHGRDAVSQTLARVRKSIWVATAGDSQIIIGATYPDPRVAVQLVRGVFDSYINWKANSANTNAYVAQKFFSELLPTYKDNLESIRRQLLDYLNNHPEPLRGNRPDAEQVEVDRIRADLQLAGTRYADALNKLEDAKLVASQNESDIKQNYTLMDAPTLPEKSNTSLRKMAINGLVFIVVGFLVSCIAILGAALLDRSFRFPLDVKHVVDLQVLAIVPDVSDKHERKNKTGASQPGQAGESSNPTKSFKARILRPR